MRFVCALNKCWVDGLWLTSDEMSLERNASTLGVVMIMEGSWFQAIIVRGKKENL